jgi:dynein heavy chain
LAERSLAVTVNFNQSFFFADESEIFGCRGAELPADEVSVQNGLLIARANRIPLCVDRQLQVVRWITEHVGQKQLRTTNFQDPEFGRILENAVEYRMVVLFEVLMISLNRY